MLVTCLNCNIEFEKSKSNIKKSPNHYCSRSCACSANNKKNPRRKPEGTCIKCGVPCRSSRQKCPKCILEHKPKDHTIAEVIYDKHHRSSAFALIRSRARTIAKNLKMNSCEVCGYDKHVEVAHIKAISEFDPQTKLSVVNDPSNLKALCPNCHWEFDNL